MAMKEGGKTVHTNAAGTAYKITRYKAHRLADTSEVEKEKFVTVSPDGGSVFHIAKLMDHTNQDVIGENGVRNDAGELRSLTKTWWWPLC